MEAELQRQQEQLEAYDLQTKPIYEEMERIKIDMEPVKALLKALEAEVLELSSETSFARLEKALEERIQKWSDYRQLIAIRAKHNFVLSLSSRGYSGKMKFDHEKRELKLHVQTNDSKATKYTKQLSGGERSFATISFLLALWEAMDCPFRILDEYDVFMDAVNRRVSTQLIIEAARNQKNRQFILISPQNMANIDLGDDVVVMRLEPPARTDSNN